MPGTSTEHALEPQRKARRLPPFRVVLHNDDVNAMQHVVAAILEITPLELDEAIERMLEAHRTGASVLLTTNRERAELYVEQFATFTLTTTCEPAA